MELLLLEFCRGVATTDDPVVLDGISGGDIIVEEDTGSKLDIITSIF